MALNTVIGFQNVTLCKDFTPRSLQRERERGGGAGREGALENCPQSNISPIPLQHHFLSQRFLEWKAVKPPTGCIYPYPGQMLLINHCSLLQRAQTGLRSLS